jgi:hypothetical protein
LNAPAIGLLSGGLVFLSIIPYAIRTYEGKIRPVPTSWSLWTLIGLAVLLTYRSAGASANVWPAVFGFANPALITILSIWRHEKWKKPNPVEWFCSVFGIASLVMWIFLHQSRELSQYALLVAIAADVCAALPTISFVWTEPDRDRPFAWLLYGFGYFLAIFAAPDNAFANWALPLYMTTISFSIALPLILHRLRRNLPLTEWV